MDNILPCPFCGSDKIRFTEAVGGFSDSAAYLYCGNCLARSPSNSYEYHTKEELASVWNARPASDIEKIIRQAFEAGKESVDIDWDFEIVSYLQSVEEYLVREGFKKIIGEKWK